MTTKSARPFSFGKVFNRYRRADERNDAEIESLAEQIDALQAERNKLIENRPHWIDRVIRPIGRAMLEHMPDRRMEVLGPFGLCCSVSIHFYLKGSTEENESDDCKSITFIYGGDEIMVRDYSKNSKQYAPNTIGELNGMNCGTIEIPDDADVDWFMSHLGE